MADLEAYRWLVGPQARRWLERAAVEGADLLGWQQRARRSLGAERARLAAQQAYLRRRAKAKFPAADRLFFLPRRLEQATDARIAAYKAARFAGRGPVADLCCGVGGDLMGLAAAAPTTGVDRDPAAALLARANCEALGLGASVCVVRADAVQFVLDPFAAWHVDPDRRPAGRRTSHPAAGRPEAAALERLAVRRPHGAVKLAPAAAAPAAWRPEAEREWIGVQGECRQQVVWLGELARRPGRIAATVVDAPGGPCTIDAETPPAPPAAEAIGRWIFEPHAAVLAAGLAGALAEQCGAAPLGPHAAYLTGDQPRSHPLLQAFEVLETLPLDRKRLRQLLRARRIGRLEIKLRGVREDPQRLRRQLQLRGDRAAVLLAAPFRGRRVAILARRPQN